MGLDGTYMSQKINGFKERRFDHRTNRMFNISSHLRILMLVSICCSLIGFLSLFLLMSWSGFLF